MRRAESLVGLLGGDHEASHDVGPGIAPADGPRCAAELRELRRHGLQRVGIDLLAHQRFEEGEPGSGYARSFSCSK